MYNLNEIENILKTLYNISGFRVSLHDIEFGEICSYPKSLTPFCAEVQKSEKIKKACINNDLYAFGKVRETGEVFVYECQCGLIEAVSPIFHYGILHGYLMIGQVCEESTNIKESLFELNRKKFESDENAAEMISGISSVPKERISDYIKIMTIIAEYITKSNNLYSTNDDLAESVRGYINANYDKKINLDELCDKFGCSKSTLCNYFKKEYGSTVYEYLMQLRMEKGKILLKTSNKSIKEIAFRCGFSDQNYFSKQFYLRCGVYPREYRNSQG